MGKNGTRLVLLSYSEANEVKVVRNANGDRRENGCLRSIRIRRVQLPLGRPAEPRGSPPLNKSPIIIQGENEVRVAKGS